MPDGDPHLARLLDPVVSLAIGVARARVKERPALDVPAAIRPLLAHKRLTNAARTTVRRVLDGDPAFRGAVAEAVDEDLGPVPTLFLLRPEGWEEEITALVAGAAAEHARHEGSTEERRAERRLRTIELKAAERSAEAAAARAEADASRADAAEARRGERQARAELAATRERLAEVEQRRIDGSAAREAAERDLAAAEGELVRLTGERDVLRADLATAQAEIVGLRAALRDNVPVEEPMLAREEVPADAAGAIALAGRAAADLGTALVQAAALLAQEQVEAEVAEQEPGVRPRRARRRAAALPPLVLEGSAEEADHVVRLDGVTVLVDGYNTTLSEWQGHALPEQRRRLVDLLGGIAARFGAHIEVVFDGAEVVSLGVPTGARHLVRVTFSPPDVEADDVIIERARTLPLPVVVVSDDRRVRVGGQAAGANVLSVAQLLGAARRG